MRDKPRRRVGPAWLAVMGDIRDMTVSSLRIGDRDALRRLPGHAAAMMVDARDLVEAMMVAGDRMARYIPGYPEAVEQVQRAELALLRELKGHLDQLDYPAGGLEGDDPRPRMLHRLLAESLTVGSVRSRTAMHVRILSNLVPDEARILAALADGTRFPLLHVDNPASGRRVMANSTTAGRAAGVYLQDAVPVYVSHLEALGLVREGPKNDTLADQYALLSSEDDVRRAMVESEGLRGNRLVYRTLLMSELGHELWDACRPLDTTAHAESVDTARGDATATAAPADVTTPPLESISRFYRSAYGGVRDTDRDRR
jgi:hypothetical protein